MSTGDQGKPRFGPPLPLLQARLERFVEPCILLFLRDRQSHGYELMERIKGMGFEGTSSDMATLYRTLHRLQEAGALTSSWEEGSQGPQRRVYQLTAAGEALLHEWARVLRERWSRLSGFLALYEEGSEEQRESTEKHREPDARRAD